MAVAAAAARALTKRVAATSATENAEKKRRMDAGKTGAWR